MFNLRYIFRLTRAFFARFKVLILAGAGLGVVFFFVLRFFVPLIGSKDATKIGVAGRYTVTNLPNPILEMIGDGLTKLNQDGGAEPNLASSWETPDRGKTWIFKLKGNLYWQDGKKVTSATVSYQFSDVTIERPDDKTIIFKLQNPYSAFPVVVSKPTFKTGLLGTGDWKVTGISLNGSFVTQISLSGKDNSKAIYKFFPTEDGTKLAFKMGQVDKIIDIFDPAPLDTWKKIKITENTNSGEYGAVFFNTQDKILSEKNVRQALSYAIDKSAFPGLRAVSPIPINSWAYNPQVKPYDFDPAKAKSMIETYKNDSKTPEIDLNLATSAVLLKQAELVQKSWQNAGVKVNLQVISQIPTDYQALLAIFDAPEDPDQYSIWHSTQTSTNITHYQNPRIDKLLEDGRSQINLEERKKTYLDFQRFLVEDSPAAFLYYPITYTISRN
jgi:peptide/nickel transport system substrate-binding protein